MLLFLQASGSERKTFSDKVSENVTYLTINKEPLHFMRIQYDFEFTFPVEICCPVLELNAEPRTNCYEKEKLNKKLPWIDEYLVKLNVGSAGSHIANCYYVFNYSKIHCKGSTEMLNYEVKQRFWSLGYECDKEKSMIGMEYNISAVIANETFCEPLHMDDCPYIVLGEPDIIKATLFLDIFKEGVRIGNPPCFKKEDVNQLVCYTAFYKCTDRGLQSSLIVPCQETCTQVVNSCGPQNLHLNLIDCSYFPSHKKLNSCILHEPNCDRPPDIENGYAVLEGGHAFLNSFPVSSRITYVCEDGYAFENTSTNQSVCQYGGFWSPIPRCLDNLKLTMAMVTILITVGALTVVVSIVLLTLFVMCRRRRKEKRKETAFAMKDYRTRDKDYDAFISYFDDSLQESHPQRDIVYQTLLPFLENECDPPFKILAHPRNFIAGNAIKDSILKAIWNSNAIIMLMSKDYAASMWCRYEFEESGFENTRDPAFRMISVMYDTVDDLGDITPEMKAFFMAKTYFDVNDPQLLEKLADILRRIRPTAN